MKKSIYLLAVALMSASSMMQAQTKAPSSNSTRCGDGGW